MKKLTPYHIANIKKWLKQDHTQKIIQAIPSYEKVDLAAFLASLDGSQSQNFLQSLLITGQASDVLAEMPESALKEIFSNINEQRLTALFHEGRPEDLVYFLSFFEEGQTGKLLDTIPLAKKIQIQKFLDYPEDTAGRVMQSPVFSVPAHFTVDQSIELLRQRAKEEPIYYTYCVNLKNQLVGVVSMRQIAISAPDTLLKELINKSVVSITTHTPLKTTAQIVSHYDFQAIPVVNDNKELVGLITKNEVIDLVREQATADLYAQVGLEENDRIFTPAWTSIKYRIPWVALNLLMAVIVSSVVSMFEQTMSRLIILASLKNIVTGIGGNTAIQTLTVITRGLAMDDFRFMSIKKSLIKELKVGIALGLSGGIGAFVITYMWKSSLLVSTVILIAMFLNSLVAVLAGACVPILLQRFNRDPAVGSGVLVTAITDIFGFFSFLGIAYLGLQLIGEQL